MRIRAITLHFREPEAFLDFYIDKLGLQSDGGRIIAGETRVKSQLSSQSHYYHFAFNIPQNKIAASIDFLEEKGLEIIRFQGKKIVEFPNWNARSVYFFDSVGNVVEFIARRDLDNASEGKFSSTDILSMSEIGMPSKSVKSSFLELQEKTSVPQYDGNLKTFCAAGNPEGLFIITHCDRDWFPTNKPSLTAPFEGVFEVEGENYNIEFSEEELNIQNI